jgi:adenylate cyclase
MSELAHILVVDDDPSIRRMFQLLLNDTGYRVSTATSGEEALAYMELVTPDLVLMDLMLPGISGQEVTQRIKADTNKPFIPVILVTAKNDQRAKVTGLDAGADDFLVKPVEFAELLARVRAMLRLQRSQRSLRAEQRKTELLLHLTRELGTTLDLDELLTHFLDRLADAVGAVRASIILTTEEQPRLYSSIRNRPSALATDILRDGIAGWVLRERKPAIIPETRDDPRWVASTVQQQMIRSAASVPIIREERVLGVITLVHHTPGYFSDEHLDLLNSVAAQSAIALENAELFRLTRSQNALLERRAEELQRLNQVSRLLTELMRPEQLLRLVTYLVHLTFGYQSVSILLRDGDDLVVRAVAGGADEETRMGRRIPIGQGISGWVAQQQEPLYIGDVQQDPRYIPIDAHGLTRSTLAVPILTAREVFGVLHVESDVVEAFGPSDVRLLDTLSGQLASRWRTRSCSTTSNGACGSLPRSTISRSPSPRSSTRTRICASPRQRSPRSLGSTTAESWWRATTGAPVRASQPTARISRLPALCCASHCRLSRSPLWSCAAPRSSPTWPLTRGWKRCGPCWSRAGSNHWCWRR